MDTRAEGGRTAAQAGWRASAYNICAFEDGSDVPVVANLYAGTMGICPDYALVSQLDSLGENHPAIRALAARGIIVDFDERERLRRLWADQQTALPTKQKRIKLTICPTMGCNFDCPYCFQEHHAGHMTEATQDHVAALVDRLLEASGAEELVVVWYGGEPLLAMDVMERLSRLMNDACVKHSAGYRASLYTNGYLLDCDAARRLFRNRVKSVRVTLDGLGGTHDATRHLCGGGPTFERIMENLSRPLPFAVEVRMNVHTGNIDQLEEVRSLIAQVAEASGNRLLVHEAEVFDTELSHARGDAPKLLGADDVKRLSLLRMNMGLHGARAHRCFAQDPYSLCIDEAGRLYSCSAVLALPDQAFGDVATWDPFDTDATAACPHNRAYFLRESLPENDPECLECLWLPTCVGGCPWLRRQGKRDCVPWKDDPQGFVIAQYGRMGEKVRDERLTPADVGKIAAPILKKYGVARAWVYGSVARGDAHVASDVDMIVEMPPGEYLGYRLFDLRRELREALGRKLDLHTPPNAHTIQSVARVIERTKVLVFGAEP